jgi:hypothetical protein
VVGGNSSDKEEGCMFSVEMVKAGKGTQVYQL